MTFDPENPVVKLCAQGMALEAEGKTAEAHQLFERAWQMASNDFEAFTAAHYLARNQQDLNEKLRWNLTALEKALAIPGESVLGTLPSLYLNVGKSHEDTGNPGEAKKMYKNALAAINSLPDTAYSKMIRSGIHAGLSRVGTPAYQHPLLASLIDHWCERKDLRPLAMVLPEYADNPGTENDIRSLISALSRLSAIQYLNSEEQSMIDQVIRELVAKLQDTTQQS